LDKSSHSRRVLIILAIFLTGLAGWQAVRIAGEERALHGMIDRPPPARTRSTGRVAPSREIATADPISRYLAASKRGTTDREIRTIVENFQTLGLDDPPPMAMASIEGRRAFRVKQDAWYALAIAEAFNLSVEQKAAMNARLAMLSAAELDRLVIPTYVFAGSTDVELDFTNLDFEQPGMPPNSFDAKEAGKDFASATHWLADEGYAPWTLCALDQQQAALTTKQLGPQIIHPSADPFDDAPAYSWLRTTDGPLAHDLTSGEWHFWLLVPDNSPGFLPGTNVFPLTVVQMSAIVSGSDDFLAQCRLLQPAQLRMALLLKPDLATDLLHRLDPPVSADSR